MSLLTDLLLDFIGLLLPGPSTDRGMLVLCLVPNPVHAEDWLFVMLAAGVLVGIWGSVYAAFSLIRDPTERPLAAACFVVNAVALLAPFVA